jgi:hypothetical protein
LPSHLDKPISLTWYDDVQSDHPENPVIELKPGDDETWFASDSGDVCAGNCVDHFKLQSGRTVLFIASSNIYVTGVDTQTFLFFKVNGVLLKTPTPITIGNCSGGSIYNRITDSPDYMQRFMNVIWKSLHVTTVSIAYLHDDGTVELLYVASGVENISFKLERPTSDKQAQFDEYVSEASHN